MIRIIPMMIGTTELLLIGGIALLLFGGKKLPEMMRGLGKGVKEFKEGMNEKTSEEQVKESNTNNEKIAELINPKGLSSAANKYEFTVTAEAEDTKAKVERKNLEKPITTKITNKEYSVKERKNNIKNILREKKKVLFTELFEEPNTGFIIVTFLSLLEMTKEREIIINQDKNFSDINIELGGK